MIYGGSNITDNLLRKSIRKRAELFFKNQDYVNASHDLEWLLLSYDDTKSMDDDDDDDWKLLKFAIISFYRLAKKSLFATDYLGRKYAGKNVEKSEYFLQKLNILSIMNGQKYKNDLYYVYEQLQMQENLNDEYDRLREKIREIQMNDEPDKPHKKLNHSNIFTGSNVLIDDYGNLIA
ncbi:hypothetical protein BLA29_011266, partial [Euroglyphus maynei]